MPPAIIAAGVGAVASVGSGLIASSAAKKAATAQETAAKEAAAAQERAAKLAIDAQKTGTEEAVAAAREAAAAAQQAQDRATQAAQVIPLRSRCVRADGVAGSGGWSSIWENSRKDTIGRGPDREAKQRNRGLDDYSRSQRYELRSLCRIGHAFDTGNRSARHRAG